MVYPKLQKDITADVVIVGGGITGLMASYLLTTQGKRVVVLEKNEIGLGATQFTTAFLTQVIDTSYSELIDAFGKDIARIVADSHKEAINIVEGIIKEEKIDCNFIRCSNFMYANSSKEMKEIEEEAAAMKGVGIEAKVSYAKGELGIVNEGFLEIKDQAKFSIKKFIPALAKASTQKGTMIFENSNVKEVTNGDGVTVKVGRYHVKAERAIIATYEPFNKPLALYFKKGFYTTYVLSANIPKGMVKEAIYEDTLQPYHYFRIDPDENADVITLGGQDHRSQIKLSPKKNFALLEEYLKKLLGGVSYEITSKWKGPILEPADGLPSIGPLANGNIILYAMAFSGNGMTYSAIAAKIFADYIAGKDNAWAEVYAASRIPPLKSLLVKGKDYAHILFEGLKSNFQK